MARPSRYAAAAGLIGLAVCVTDAVSKALGVADISPYRPVACSAGCSPWTRSAIPAPRSASAGPTPRSTPWSPWAR